jgi:hypothetical protein
LGTISGSQRFAGVVDSLFASCISVHVDSWYCFAGGLRLSRVGKGQEVTA